MNQSHALNKAFQTLTKASDMDIESYVIDKGAGHYRIPDLILEIEKICNLSREEIKVGLKTIILTNEKVTYARIRECIITKSLKKNDYKLDSFIVIDDQWVTDLIIRKPKSNDPPLTLDDIIEMCQPSKK